MNYALLPFLDYESLLHRSHGKPDIRTTLAERERRVAPHAIDNLELLTLVVETLRELPWQFRVDHCRERDGDVWLAVMAWDLGRDLEPGDVLNAGFFLQNSESGVFETLVCPRVFRVACRNGTLVERERGQCFEIVSGETETEDWPTAVQEVVPRSFDRDEFDVELARYRVTTERMLVAPYEMLCHLVAQGLVTDDEQADIQAAFDDAADFTMYGLVNAVTSIAHRLRHDDRWRRAFEIERLGGEVLHGAHDVRQFDPVFS